MNKIEVKDIYHNDVAVFVSRDPQKNDIRTHCCIYLKEFDGSGTLSKYFETSDYVLVNNKGEQIKEKYEVKEAKKLNEHDRLLDVVLVYDNRNYDLILTDRKIYTDDDPELWANGGIFNGDLDIKEDHSFDKEMICCGKVTVEKDVCLTVLKNSRFDCENLIVYGTLAYSGKDFPFKPGHVVGPGTVKKEDMPPACYYVADKITFEQGSKGISGRKGTLRASRGEIKSDLTLDGMTVIDELTIKEGVKVSLSGSWIQSVLLIMEDNSSLDLSETEICVLKYKAELGEGYYAHYGYGTTVVGKNVKIFADKSFVWLWLGRISGEFEDVAPYVYLRTDKKVYGRKNDLNNFTVSDLQKDSVDEHIYHLSYKELNKEYEYESTKDKALDALLNNKIQDAFPGYMLWGGKGVYFGFSEPHMRSGNILIHKIQDFQTLRDLSDIYVQAKEEK